MQPQRDFSIYGAVDLGARQAARRRQQAAGSDAASTGTTGYVIDVTDETFASAVVERSRHVPVVLDLWATWCGPCKQLGPVLEKLAGEAAGRWILARVDVDANPQLTRALQVQSIPMVVAVVGGRPVDGFLGALPEAQVRQWLDRVIAVAEQLGLHASATGQPSVDGHAAGAGGDRTDESGSSGIGGSDPRYAKAQRAMQRGDAVAAADAFREILDQTPGDPIATVGLARVELAQRVASYDEREARAAAARQPDDVTAQCRVADIDLAAGRVEEAFDRLLGVVKRTTGEDRDRARAHLVNLFATLPPGDPRVSQARTTLSNLLF